MTIAVSWLRILSIAAIFLIGGFAMSLVGVEGPISKVLGIGTAVAQDDEGEEEPEPVFPPKKPGSTIPRLRLPLTGGILEDNVTTFGGQGPAPLGTPSSGGGVPAPTID